MAAWYATFIVLVCTSLTHGTTFEQNPLSNDFINQINKKQTTWKAGRNFPVYTSMKFIKNLVGSLKGDTAAKLQKLEHTSDLLADLPKKFDPREKWPNCPSLNEIRDQGSCASCWAFGAVAAMTDRYCIFSIQTQQFHFSAEDLISCCETCGLGCIRGVHTAAWEYWKRVGLVSGGNYKSKQGCKPYSIPGRNATGASSPLRRTADISECVKSCDSKSNIDYYKDKRYGKSVYSIDSNEDQIKVELLQYGPVEGVMTVYADFLHYKNGVYKNIQGNFLGYHAVKILGWGEENGVKYWHVANSWSNKWGDKGFFKILRGQGHCGIESYIVAGEPIIV